MIPDMNLGISNGGGALRGEVSRNLWQDWP